MDGRIVVYEVGGRVYYGLGKLYLLPSRIWHEIFRRNVFQTDVYCCLDYPPMPNSVPKTQLDHLKQMTVVVADTGDFEKVKRYQPQDATTNPTLILQAVQSGVYESIVSSAISASKAAALTGDALLHDVCDRLSVLFGVELLRVVPGRVSTEVDACLSFDVQATVAKARKLIGMYKELGIDESRVLIKLAATWEGVEACRQLESEGIRCNMTLIFNFEQAIACAQAHATLISPFVGRILDWHKTHNPQAGPYSRATDPGVVSVTKIYRYFKSHGHRTVVMGASFRSKDQILGLAGIDALTISPKLLEELESDSVPFTRALSPDDTLEPIPAIEVSETKYRWSLNEDTMASDKLSEGIRNFNKDLERLREVVRSRL